MTRFVSWLGETSQPWLVVLDDLPETSYLDEVWQAGSAGRLLVTSSQPASATGWRGTRVIPVGCFSVREALNCLTERLSANRVQRLGAIDLVETLGREPLALAQASAVIAGSTMDCLDYRDLFVRRRQQIRPSAGEMPSAAMLTWTLSLALAESLRPGTSVTLMLALVALPPARVAAIISAVASALDAAHAAGLVHRDIKPANMLVDTRPGRPDHVYLSDFGLTRGALSLASQTGSDHFMGTPTYCAPEQIRGHQVDARTDEYALACAVYALLSGEPPFSRDEGIAVLYAHLSTPPPPLTSRRSGLSPAVDDVLLRALAKAPEDRYASCGEFADAMRLALGLQRYDSDVATALHQRSLVDQQHRLGLDHADTLAKHTGSAASREERRPDEAIALHRQILADQQRTLGRDHPDTLATWFAIARELAARGDHAAAEEHFWDVLTTRLRTLGPDHPDTLATRFSIAQEMAARGEHAGAEVEFRAVLPHLRRRLGADHPDTLATRLSIAREMAARGEHAEAEGEFREVLPHLERKLGPDHPDTLAAAEWIANMGYDQR